MTTKHKNSKKIVLGILFLALIITIAVIGFKLYKNSQYDEKAVVLNKKSLYREQVKDQLQEQADLSDFHFRISGEGIFRGGTKKPGNLFIENPADSKYSMQVTIQDKKTGGRLYRSPVLKPGENVNSFPLKKELSKGEHLVSAAIAAIQPDTKKELGQVSADINIIVK